MVRALDYYTTLGCLCKRELEKGGDFFRGALSQEKYKRKGDFNMKRIILCFTLLLTLLLSSFSVYAAKSDSVTRSFYVDGEKITAETSLNDDGELECTFYSDGADFESMAIYADFYNSDDELMLSSHAWGDNGDYLWHTQDTENIKDMLDLSYVNVEYYIVGDDWKEITVTVSYW